MITDLAVCEWNPGINRSIVSIEIAAKRVRSEDRFLLISRFNTKLYDDQVTINHKEVTSKKAQYSAVIANMNFGTGRICNNVTRKKWKEKDAVSAIVFWINGRAYGYASACGNLFELTLLADSPSLPPPTVTTIETPTTTEETFHERTTRESIVTQTESSSFQSRCDCESTGIGYGWGWYPSGGSGTIPYLPPKHHEPRGPTPPIPELPVWAYLGLGPLIVILRRLRHGRPTAI